MIYTLEIAEIDISEALLGELKGRADPELVEPLGPLSFDDEGDLKPTLLSKPLPTRFYPPSP